MASVCIDTNRHFDIIKKIVEDDVNKLKEQMLKDYEYAFRLGMEEIMISNSIKISSAINAYTMNDININIRIDCRDRDQL